MKRVAELFKDAGMALEQLGQTLGYEGTLRAKPRGSSLNKTSDPRLSMLHLVAKAVKVNIMDLGKEIAHASLR